MQLWCSAVGHPPASGWGQLLQVKRQRGGSQAVDPWGQLGRAGDYSAPSGAAVPVSGPGAGVGVMPGAATKSLRLTAASPIRDQHRCHMGPTLTWDPNGFPAGPGSGKRQHGQRRPGAWDACASDSR